MTREQAFVEYGDCIRRIGHIQRIIDLGCQNHATIDHQFKFIERALHLYEMIYGIFETMSAK